MTPVPVDKDVLIELIDFRLPTSISENMFTEH